MRICGGLTTEPLKPAQPVAGLELEMLSSAPETDFVCL